LNVLRF